MPSKKPPKRKARAKSPTVFRCVCLPLTRMAGARRGEFIGRMQEAVYQ